MCVGLGLGRLGCKVRGSRSSRVSARVGRCLQGFTRCPRDMARRLTTMMVLTCIHRHMFACLQRRAYICTYVAIMNNVLTYDHTFGARIVVRLIVTHKGRSVFHISKHTCRRHSSGLPSCDLVLMQRDGTRTTAPLHITSHCCAEPMLARVFPCTIGA